MPRRTIIHVVDDDEDFRVAISRVLEASGYEVRTYANVGAFLLSHFDDSPACILLDLRMPGPSGLDLQEALAKRMESWPIIFLSGRGDIPSTVRAMKAGAADFLTKPVQREALFSAIRTALARDAQGRIVREQLKNWRACYETLSARELEVFERVVTGKMNKEIADEINAAERTVKTHRSQVMQKMHTASLAELIHIADQLRANGVVRRDSPRPT